MAAWRCAARASRGRKVSPWVQSHGRNSVELAITTRVFAFAEGSVELTHGSLARSSSDKLVVRPGENAFTHNITIDNPRLWWPNGHGEQHLYDFRTTLDGERTTRRLGLRQLDWVIEKDRSTTPSSAASMGRDIFCFAQTDPADALPSRIHASVGSRFCWKAPRR